MAPLPAGLALGLGGALQDVAVVAEEADHVVEVEAVPHRATVDGAARVATAHGLAPQNTGRDLIKTGQKKGFGV